MSIEPWMLRTAAFFVAIVIGWVVVISAVMGWPTFVASVKDFFKTNPESRGHDE